MSEIDNNVMPLAEDPHNLGEFDNVYQAMRRYPNGGTEDDYIYILGVKHFWNTNRQTWGILKDKEDNLVQMVEDFIMLFYNKGYSFAGIAHPDTVPSEYDGVFYIAAENGTYVNFGNNIKVENEVAIISKARKGDWVKNAVAIPNNERIDGIDSLITTIQETLQAHAQAIVGIEGDIDNLYDSIDETNQDLAELGQTVEEYKELNDKKDEEQDDRIDDVEERLDYIPKESFLSSEPACDYHEEDNVDELTADRAMRDRFGRMIDEEYLTRDAAKNYTQEVVDGSKLEIMPGSVKPEDLSPAVQEMIEAGAGKPGNITNLPDEEDLTVSENNVLKLKDKEYNPYNYSGMGRVYLRKHIVNGTNILAQHMINKPNTIYIIQYDYCLGGETIEIPENCVLQFEGGSLRNGGLLLNNTVINSSTKYLNVTTKGFFKNSIVIVDNLEYGFYHIQCVNGTAVLNDNILVYNSECYISCSIIGNNYKIYNETPISRLLSVIKSGVVIESVHISNKAFKNGPLTFCVYTEKDTLSVRNCFIEGYIACYNRDDTYVGGSIIIQGNRFEVDSSLLDQDYIKQKDILILYGYKSCSIDSNVIIAKNINRVIKTSCSYDGISDPDYSEFIITPQEISVTNNTIISNSINGKQVWDMYAGTANTLIEHNHIEAFGHVDIFENKTQGDKEFPSNITIRDNYIKTDWRLMYIRMAVVTDSIILENNTIEVTGDNTTRTNQWRGDEERQNCATFYQLSKLRIVNNRFIRTGKANINILNVTNMFRFEYKDNFHDNYNGVYIYDYVTEAIISGNRYRGDLDYNAIPFGIYSATSSLIYFSSKVLPPSIHQGYLRFSDNAPLVIMDTPRYEGIIATSMSLNYFPEKIITNYPYTKETTSNVYKVRYLPEEVSTYNVALYRTTQKGATTYSKEQNCNIYFDGEEWRNEDSTLCTKVRIV